MAAICTALFPWWPADGEGVAAELHRMVEWADHMACAWEWVSLTRHGRPRGEMDRVPVPEEIVELLYRLSQEREFCEAACAERRFLQVHAELLAGAA